MSRVFLLGQKAPGPFGKTALSAVQVVCQSQLHLSPHILCDGLLRVSCVSDLRSPKKTETTNFIHSIPGLSC